jgi:hypothetical protein
MLRQQLLPEGKGDDRALDKALKERGASLNRVREQIAAEVPELLFRMRVVQDKFLKSLREKYNPTDEQVRLMFEQVFPARIFVSAEKHTDKAQARINEAHAALKEGKPFAKSSSNTPTIPTPSKSRADASRAAATTKSKSN